MCNIKSITPIGAHQTYDLEVQHPDHQFYLTNGMLTSNSHATAYAIDSYMCAWLLTHYEEEWLTSYLESMSANPEDKAKAISDIKSMGYQVVSVDVNHATKGWTVLPGKKFVPSLLSVKGVGTSAIDELFENRPYKNIEDFLWDENGDWKHSKFNKRALEAMIKVGGFDSLECVGEDKLFKTYRHMYEVLVNNMDEIKKTSKRDPGHGRRRFYELAREVTSLPDWTMQERAANQVDALGALDVCSLIPPETLEQLKKKQIKSIDDHDGKDLYWFLVTEQTVKKTRKGSAYLRLAALGMQGTINWLNVWAWKEDSKPIPPYALCLAEVEKNEMGFSSASWKLKILT